MQFFRRKKGYTHPKDHKELTIGLPIENASVPKLLYFFLSAHVGKPAKPVVKVGDRVKMGSIIAKADAEVSSNVHSSVSGEVYAIEERDYLGDKATCIIIRNDFHDEKDEPVGENKDDDAAEDIVSTIREAGIAGMGGAMFPTDVKLSPEEELHTLIVNGAECEPYSNSDARLMIERAEQIAEGIKIVSQIYSFKKIFIAIEDNAPESISAMKKAVAEIPNAQVITLDSAYPQGAEQVLIKNLTGKEIPSGEQPPSIGMLVINVGTLYSIYEAVKEGKPVIERVVTVSGNKVKQPKNLLARLGTPIDSLINDCGGVSETPVKIIHGGPLMGKTVTNRETPVANGTTTIAVLFSDDVEKRPAVACIRCSECVNVCPVSLQPILIHNAFERENFDKAEKLGALDCIQCGNCSYICPSDIHLLESIRGAVVKIKEKKEKNEKKATA